MSDHQQTVHGRSLRSSLAILVCALVAAFVAYQLWQIIQRSFSKRRREIDIPVVNLEGSDYAGAVAEYIKRAAFYYRKGREQYPDQPYQLYGTEGYMIVIPEAWVDEFKNADMDTLDNEALIKSIIGEYEWVQLAHPIIPYTITGNLTPKLGTFVDSMLEEIDFSIQTELPQSHDWAAVNAASFIMKTVAMASGRVFVGPSLNRDPVWMQAGIDYAIDVFKAGERVRTLPYLAGIVGIKLGYFKEVNTVYRRQRDARRLIVPIIKARAAARKADPDWKAPNDMIQFLMDAPHAANKTFQEQAEIQLVVALVSIQTTSHVATNLLYDLCAHPEYIEPLRREIEEVLQEEGGQLSKKALAKMNKLDSFVKESQRLHPAQLTTFDRIVSARKGITFANGFHLPHGTRFGVATAAMNTDPHTFPGSSSPPDVFDGFRFSALRGAHKADATKHQFVTTNARDSLSFSHGKHACPGRFMASMEIKLIVASLLQRYDLQFAGGRTERPECLMFGHNTRPDPSVEIAFRRRAGAI